MNLVDSNAVLYKYEENNLIGCISNTFSQNTYSITGSGNIINLEGLKITIPSGAVSEARTMSVDKVNITCPEIENDDSDMLLQVKITKELIDDYIGKWKKDEVDSISLVRLINYWTIQNTNTY